MNQCTVKLFLLFCANCCFSSAHTVDVCIKNENSLTEETLRHVENALRAHQKDFSAAFRFTCQIDAANPVVITLRDAPATGQLADALGAARVRDGKVVGQFEVFCDPVRKMVRRRKRLSPALEGWAVARVAAHEMYHHLRNELGHGSQPLNEEFLTPDDLIQGFRKQARAPRKLD